METKKCGRCHTIKPKSEFYRRLNGLMSQCKVCTKKISTDRYLSKKEEIKSRTTEYYIKHQEKIKQYSKTYREKNKEKVREIQRLWRERNPNYFKEYWKNSKK
jgi:recombinational DNA repair protein (RecF pathway)